MIRGPRYLKFAPGPGPLCPTTAPVRTYIHRNGMEDEERVSVDHCRSAHWIEKCEPKDLREEEIGGFISGWPAKYQQADDELTEQADANVLPLDL